MTATVAIAGGTGGLGRALVEAVLRQKSWKVVVLSRHVSPESTAGKQQDSSVLTHQANSAFEQDTKVPVIQVDYGSIPDMVKVLEDHNVETVISAMKVASSGDGQVNLIKAANLAKPTKRFIPTIYGIPFNKERLEIYPTSKHKYQGVQELQRTSLNYTLVYNGFLLDYMGKKGQHTYMAPQSVVLDIANNAAAIPGDGEKPVVFTHSFDVANYVSRLLGLPKWDEESYIIGDKLTFNEFVKLAEEVTGSSFQVTYDSVDLLRSGQVTELPGHVALYDYVPKKDLQAILAILEIDLASGVYDFEGQKTLNDIFPDISPMTARQVLERAWKPL